MLTIKFCAGRRVILTFIAAALLAGCGAPGPRALLTGKKLLDQGRYEEAIEKLKLATSLLPTNGLAWNYLGLACHQAGKVAEAEQAYRKALERGLNEAHYNRGCLELAQNRPEEAKSELTAFTLGQANSFDGWFMLAKAQQRLREFSAAESSFNAALRLSNAEPAALTGLGVVRAQRGFPRDAVQHFNSALKVQTNYAPALLNLAIVAQEQLKDRNLALQKYREYLEVKPVPSNAEAVRAIVRQLELEVVAALPRPAEPARAPSPRAAFETGASKPSATNTAKIALLSKAATNATTTPKAAPKPPPMAAVPPGMPASTPAMETVKLSAEQVFKPAEDVPSTPRVATAPVASAPAQPSAAQSPDPAADSAKAPKRGFLQKINPLNLFAASDPPKARITPLPDAEKTALAPTAVAAGEPAASEPLAARSSSPAIARYHYRSPSKPVAGNRTEAERAFAQGVQAQQAQRLPETLQAYRRATQLDPSFFDAQYNLGLAASQAGNTQTALNAYEVALAIRPESLDARYNFALLLKQGEYYLDAVAELQKILTKYPNDSRSHLAAGNIYAQQLHQPAQARKHYLRVLDTDPRNPQAGAIRYWLADNPK